MMQRLLRDLGYVVGSLWREESNRDQRVKRLLLFVGWQLWKRTVGVPLLVPLFNEFRFLAYPDCGVSSSVLYARIPNSRSILFLREHVDGGTLVDVGANVGLVSLLLADRVRHALLFEPNPVAAARARENLAINRLDFEVHELALSDQTGTVEFENTGGVDSCNRTVVGFKPSVPTIPVSRTTFDRFLEDHGALPTPITVVKIDVEGHENAVLCGMEYFLKTQRPRILMFEYLRRTNLTETFEIFGRAGYRIIELKAGGPAWATTRVSPLQDLFACPEELAAEFIPSAPTGDVEVAGEGACAARAISRQPSD